MSHLSIARKDVMADTRQRSLQQIAQMACNSIINGFNDHYFKHKAQWPELTQEEYWRRRLKLTHLQTIDSYIQSHVSAAMNSGLAEVDAIVKKAWKSIFG